MIQMTGHFQGLTSISLRFLAAHYMFDNVVVAFKQLEAKFIIPFQGLRSFPCAFCFLGLITDAES